MKRAAPRKRCEHCGKYSHYDLLAAIRGALWASARFGRPMRFYICPYNAKVWHLTSGKDIPGWRRQ